MNADDVAPVFATVPLHTIALSAAAVIGLLNAAASDPDLRRALRREIALWERLCFAEAALVGRGAEEVLLERAAERPEGPRLLMTYEEWTRARAAQVEREGELGSHWPDKATALERHSIRPCADFAESAVAMLKGFCWRCGWHQASHGAETGGLHVSQR